MSNPNKTPTLRFTGFPDPWEQRKLSEIGEVITGSTPSTQHPEYYSEDGIPWVTPTDITENVVSDTPRKLSSLGAKVGRVVPAETILVTCIASIGKNTMLANTGSFNQQINGLVPNKQKFDPYFLLTESYHWSVKMKREAAAGTMQIVNKNEFSAIETFVPGLPEQRAIGNYFRDIDNLITIYVHIGTINRACILAVDPFLELDNIHNRENVITINVTRCVTNDLGRIISCNICKLQLAVGSVGFRIAARNTVDHEILNSLVIDETNRLCSDGRITRNRECS